MSINATFPDEDLKNDEHVEANEDFIPTIESGGSGDSSSKDDSVNATNNDSDNEEDNRPIVSNEDTNNNVEIVDVITDFTSELPPKKDDECKSNIDVPTTESSENIIQHDKNDKEESDKLSKISDVTTEPSNVDCTNDKGDNFVDILGNGLLTKRITSKGLGRDTRPTHGDSVTIRYSAWNSEHRLFAEAENETFVLGDGDMVQAFDLALCLAEKGEEFELKTDARFAYGVQGLLPDVHPGEALTYRITLLSVDEAPNYTAYSYEDRLQAADKKRERGNYLYKREEFSYAVNSYSRAIKIIESDPEFKADATAPSMAALLDLFIKVTNNLAASQLKLESHDSVIETCDRILAVDPINVKALFRRGKALSNRGNIEEAIVVFKRAMELEPKNALVVNEVQRCARLRKAENEQSAKLCRRMFPFAADNNAGSPAANDGGSGGRWRRYAPYAGAVLITGLSVALAALAVGRSTKG